MGQKPPVTISSLYEARLEKILASLDRNLLPNGEELQTELDRANIVALEEMPPDVVTMNSTVIFRMQPSNREFSLTLVYPSEIDGSVDKISILAPVGSALLGLREGDEISWPRPGGGSLQVCILKVLYINQSARVTSGGRIIGGQTSHGTGTSHSHQAVRGRLTDLKCGPSPINSY